jgi:mono/diheme cytochrome c family protein
MQFFHADLIRGMSYGQRDGRRVLARTMHDPQVDNPITACAAPAGSVRLGADGSMAAFVPAQRAMSWQLTDNVGTGIVRERFWLTFQPGEMRVCASCHGLNDQNQMGQPEPTNPPEALRTLLQYWQDKEGFVGPDCDRLYLPMFIK